MRTAPLGRPDELPHAPGRRRHSWLLLIAESAWLGLIAVAWARASDAIAYRVFLIWAVGAATIWGIGWAVGRLRSWYRSLDWRALGGAVAHHPLGVALAVVAVTLIPFLLGAVLDVHVLLAWGVFTAYTAIAWALPAVLVWLAAKRRLEERGVRRHKLLSVVISIAVALALLIANAAIIGAFDSAA